MYYTSDGVGWFSPGGVVNQEEERVGEDDWIKIRKTNLMGKYIGKSFSFEWEKFNWKLI